MKKLLFVLLVVIVSSESWTVYNMGIFVTKNEDLYNFVQEKFALRARILGCNFIKLTDVLYMNEIGATKFKVTAQYSCVSGNKYQSLLLRESPRTGFREIQSFTTEDNYEERAKKPASHQDAYHYSNGIQHN